MPDFLQDGKKLADKRFGRHVFLDSAMSGISSKE